MSKRLVFYIIDDSEQTSEILQSLITKVFPTMYVKRFNDGFSAYKSLEKEKLDAVIICEYDIQGINGLQLLKKIRSVEGLRDTYFIMMSANTDREILVKSVQTGVDDFMQKPVSLDQFILKLKNTSRFLNLQNKNAKLEEDYNNLLAEFEPLAQRLQEFFQYIQSVRTGEKDSEIARIVSACKFIAKQLTNDEEEIAAIIKAAELCYLPKGLFRDKYVEMPVMINGIVQNQIMANYVEFVDKLFTGFRGFEDVQKILRSVYENFDGSGIPEKVKAWAIPLGSRILRAAIDFESYYARNPRNVDKIIPLMWGEINRVYDFRVLAFYEQYLGYLNTLSNQAKRATEAVVNPFVLSKGMITSRSIVTVSGLKLLNEGAKLDDDAIKKIQEAKSAEAYLGHIFIKIESIPISPSK
ncbi:MAG: response regulator [Candidatus Kapabacteria bacterium]|nr:response regulator [Ignavibacteriota bacterium]MCW5884531.1 response regulator [Candidatus Kapabacteria bacterium]